MGLSPELIAEIQQLISTGQLIIPGVTGTKDGRSPFRPRQLTRLDLPPAKDDPRPQFHWSAEAPRDNSGALHFHTPYPRLLWAKDGTEVCVLSREEHQRLVAEGYLEKDPGTIVLDPMDAMRQMLEQLDPADRELVLNGAKKARMLAIQEKLGDFSAEDVNALAGAVTVKGKKSA